MNYSRRSSSPVPIEKPEQPLIKPGTKVRAGHLVLRDRRPPLNETAHVADSQRSSLDSLFNIKRSRTIAKGDGLVRFGMEGPDAKAR